MINEPRIYRRSPIQLIVIIVLLGIFSIGFLTTISQIGYVFLIPFAIFLGIVLLTVLNSMTQKTTISDDGISTQNFLGGKSLRWNEINRVSGRGYVIKLHNFDGDMTVFPSPQLPGYEEVVDWIGIKRPDLFNPLEYGEIKRGWLGLVPLVVLALVLAGTFVGFGIAFSKTPQSPDILYMPMFFVAIIFIVFLGLSLFSPQLLTLDGKSLFVKYLFGEKTLMADEITSVELRYTQTRNGKSYFILLTQTNRKSLRISGLSLSLPIVYLVLKNWHKKNAAIGLTNQQN
jgi:hypothetical protein